MPSARANVLQLSPTPDGAAGARVHLPAGTARAAISGLGLQAVDILADGALVELHLSGCGPGLFVTLQGTERLERLSVPETGPGAVLFLALSTLSTPLRVDGAVQCLDVACTDARGRPASFRVDGDGEVFRGAWLGSGGTVPHAEAGVVALCDGNVDGAWLSHATAVRAMVLSRCRARAGLSTPCALRSLVLSDVETPSLSFQATEFVRLERCNSLASISGHSGRLVIRGGSNVPVLTITGHVGEADIFDIRCTSLHIPSAQRLALQANEQLRELHTLASDDMIVDISGGHSPKIFGRKNVAVRPLTPEDIEHEFLHGTEAGRAGMLTWARNCKKTGEYWLALQVLASAIDTGLPAGRAWKDRCELTPRGRGAGAWEWNFPDDLAVRGWTADVRLWLRCLAEEVPEAIAYAEIMASGTQPAHLAALLAVAASTDLSDDERTLLTEMALRALEHGTKDGERLDMKVKEGKRTRVGISAVNADWLQQAFRALLELAPLPVSRTLARAWADWLFARAPIVEGVQVLGGLAAHGCERAQGHLVTLQQQAPGRKDLDRKGRSALARAVALQLLQPERNPKWGGGPEEKP
ncbi:MAG: hypothetical protein RL653_2504 [Pseudomonadota bacterium]|jgi:hypothetical protein